MNTGLEAGTVIELAAGVRRLVAPNPGVMTGPGTNTYIVGGEDVAIIDPGPAIERHVDALCAAVSGSIRWIFVTHTHPDHSPGASELAARTGAAIVGLPAPDGRHQDRSFKPDRLPLDGETFTAPEFELKAIRTPGHASNHVCYRHAGLQWLFTGDHIIDGATVVIDPPDGNMRDYLRSLEKLKREDVAAIAPGHGNLLLKPLDVIEWIVEHRLQREAKVAARLAANPAATLSELVARVYDDVDRSLHPIAERSLLAHLEKLEADGRAVVHDDRWRSLDRSLDCSVD